MKSVRVVAIMVCILCGGVFADFNWNVESGYWSDGANWMNTSTSTTGTKPDGSANVNLRYSGTSVCTLNTDEGLFTNRLIVQNGQTWNIENGGRVGFGWSRVGRNTAATVNMSGNGAFVMNNDDLYIGVDAGGSCTWTMSDTSSITVNDSGGNLGDVLYIAQNTASGTLKLVGSGVTVHTNELYIGRAGTAGTSPTATLEFVMNGGGASTIVTDVATWILGGTLGAEAAAHLVLSATESLADQDIVLVNCLGTNAIGGAGVFTTLNGGSAAEGTHISLGGNTYSLTYAYDADGTDLAYNDIALVLVPEPATIVLVGLGCLSLLKRRR